MGLIGRPETSVTNYKPALRNISEERRPQLYCGGSLQSRKHQLNKAAPWTFSSTVFRFYQVYCTCSQLVLCINIISLTGLCNMNYVHFVRGKNRLSMPRFVLVSFSLATLLCRRQCDALLWDDRITTFFVMLAYISYPKVLKLHVYICVLFRKKYLISPGSCLYFDILSFFLPFFLLFIHLFIYSFSLSFFFSFFLSFFLWLVLSAYCRATNYTQ
jgi:hypothetical protein